MNSSALKIQKVWRGCNGRQNLAFQLCRRACWVRGGATETINPMQPELAVEIEYCVKHARIRTPEEEEAWEFYLHAIEYSLWEHEFQGGPGAKYYCRAEHAKENLRVALGFLENWATC